MLVFFAECAPLSIDIAGRIARDVFERHLEDGREEFCRVLLLITFRVFLAGLFYRADHRFKLIEEQRVCVNDPAVDLKRIVAHASSSGSGASRSTSTPLTKALPRDTSDFGTGRIRAGSFVMSRARNSRNLPITGSSPSARVSFFAITTVPSASPRNTTWSRLPRASILRIAAGTVVCPRAVTVAGISRISAVFAIAGSLD